MHRIDLGRQDLEVLPPFFCFNLPRQHLLQQTQQPILQVQQPIQQTQHLICRGISKQNKCKINVNKLTLDYVFS